MTFLTRLTVPIVALALGVAGSFAPLTAANAGGVLTVPEADWTGGQVTCRVIEILLEDHLGYKIKRVNIPSGPAVWEGLRSGDFDFACEVWPSYNAIKSKYVTEYGGDGSVIKLGDSGIIGVSNYYVPRYLVEGPDAKAPGLKKFTDLNKYVDLFKTMETGDKGKLLGCPVAAWACDDQKRLDALGVNFTAVELGSETAQWAEMQAAYKRHEPFVAYAWEPHWIHAALDLVPLTLPAYDAAKWPATGWAKDVTFNDANPSMLTKHADAAKLISRARLTNDQQAGMILAIDVDGKDIDKVVRAWMDKNQNIWKPWLVN